MIVSFKKLEDNQKIEGGMNVNGLPSLLQLQKDGELTRLNEIGIKKAKDKMEETNSK